MLIRCNLCGHWFDDGYPEKFHGRHKIYCEGCGKAREAERKAGVRGAERAARQRALVDKREEPLREDARRAVAAGMTYGKLKDLERKRAREEAKADDKKL